jgi:hypothetical protein
MSHLGCHRRKDVRVKGGEYSLLAVIAVGLQHPRKVPKEVLHAWLFLRGEEERLHQHRGVVGDNGTELLYDALRVRQIGNHKLGHMNQGGDRLVDRPSPGLREVEHDGQKIAAPERRPYRLQGPLCVSV